MVGKRRCCRRSGQIRRLLKTSPSLQREVADIIADEVPASRQNGAALMAFYGETPIVLIEGLSCTEDQVLRPWFPDDRE